MVAYYRKGYSSRFNKVLSARRVFGRKGRHSQASQIWQLKKKLVSYIKRTRPETVIQQHSTENVLLDQLGPGVGGQIGQCEWTYTDGSGNISTANRLQPVIEGGSYEGVPVKNEFARLYNCLIEGVFRYRDAINVGDPITLRLVIIQTKTTRAQHITVDDVFRRPAQTTSGHALSVFGPLQTGVSSTCAILRDKLYTLQPNNRSSIKIWLNLKKLINFKADTF